MTTFTFTRRAKDRQGNFKPDGQGTKSCIVYSNDGTTDLYGLNCTRFSLGPGMFASLKEVPEGFNVAGSNTDYGIIREGDVLRIKPVADLPEPPRTRAARTRATTARTCAATASNDKTSIIAREIFQDIVREMRNSCMNEDYQDDRDDQDCGNVNTGFGYRRDKARARTGWSRMAWQ